MYTEKNFLHRKKHIVGEQHLADLGWGKATHVQQNNEFPNVIDTVTTGIPHNVTGI